MNKLLDKITIIVLSVVVLAFSVLSIVVPDKELSDKENRALEKLPKLTSDSLFSGDYTSKLGVYFADQFAFRDAFVGVKAYAELFQLKKENNGVVYTKEALIPYPANDTSMLSRNIQSIEEFAKNNELSVTVAPLPRTADVFSEYLPSSYPLDNDLLVWSKLRSEASQNNFNMVDLYDLLCRSNAYYRTDHHYTTDGAYLTYKALADSLGYFPFAKEFFDVQCVSKDFEGTSMRSSGFYLYDRDTINLYRYDGDADYTVIADNKEIDLYDFTKLEQTDKYAVFLGGNHARVDITKNGEYREKLLIIRDSFADSLVPFLALHFDITLVDLRYFTNNVAALCKDESIDKVLVLANVDELCSSKNFERLRLGTNVSNDASVQISISGIACESIMNAVLDSTQHPESENVYLASSGTLDTYSMSLWADGLFSECAEFSLLTDYAIYVSAGTTIYELAVFKTASADNTVKLVDLLERRKENLANGQKGMYDPYFESRISNSKIITDGEYAMLIITDDNNAAIEAINNLK